MAQQSVPLGEKFLKEEKKKNFEGLEKINCRSSKLSWGVLVMASRVCC